MRCHWARDEKGFKFWFPHCYGGAVYGPYQCHCPKATTQKGWERLEFNEKMKEMIKERDEYKEAYFDALRLISRLVAKK